MSTAAPQAPTISISGAQLLALLGPAADPPAPAPAAYGGPPAPVGAGPRPAAVPASDMAALRGRSGALGHCLFRGCAMRWRDGRDRYCADHNDQGLLRPQSVREVVDSG
jgi:hypothetical protein